jgi:autotransporter-associated beta strand protein
MKQRRNLVLVPGALLVVGIALLWRINSPDETLASRKASPVSGSSSLTEPDAPTMTASDERTARPEAPAMPALPGKVADRPDQGNVAALAAAQNDGGGAPVPPLAVDASLVAKLVAAGEGGQEISFPLPGGGIAKGKVEWSKLRDGMPILVQGPLTAPRPGFFFFNIPPAVGVAGELVGFVRFDEGEVAYRVEPGKDGKPELVQRDIDDIMCRNLARRDEEHDHDHAEHADEAEHGVVENAPEDHPANSGAGNIPAYQNGVPSLQSLPGASGVLYLDFDGEKGPFASWGNFDAAPSGLSTAQIRATWEHVAEDYAPFNLNVTTDLQAYLAAPETSRQRCIITPSSPVESGVAYIGSFNWGSDVVCWAGYRGDKVGFEVVSHEMGHTLNLGHDGRTSPVEEYYGGHGNGEVGWAPIMGASYYKNLTQWSKGEYPNPSQTQDDLVVINNNNNVDNRADDYGNDFAGASYLEILAGNAVSNQGVIETGADFDTFRFTTTATGNVSLTVGRNGQDQNLDILAEIVRSSDGVVISSANPDTLLDATVTANNLAAGTYFLRVSGVGRGNVSTDGYSDYASLGHYKVSGTVPNGVQPDRLAVAENSANGTAVGTVTPRNNHGAAVLSYAIASGNGLGAFQINSATGQLTVANSAPLNYESLSTRYDDPATIELFVTITDTSNPSLNETVRVVVSATDVNEAHSITGPAVAQIFRNAKVGTAVAGYYVDGPDQFENITWSITSGNGGGAFSISTSGVLTVANSTALAAQTTHNLQITATDNGPPSPVITANRAVTVNTLLWSPGDAVYVRNWTQEAGVTASQSTTYGGGVASRAIDGNTNGNWGAGSVSHTDNGSNSWWEVDLGTARLVGVVQLFNRTDGAGTRLSNFRVTVLDASRAELAGQSFYQGSGSVGTSETWTLASAVTGRYVRVQFLGNNNDGNGFLSLAEVIVSEPPPPNVALASGGAVATQSTTYQSGVASRAIDGNTDGNYNNGSVSHTGGSLNDWWQVNLGAPYSINQLVFYNRTDGAYERLSNFKVSVWNGATEVYSSNHFTEPGTWASNVFSLSQIEGIVGDRVKIEFLGLNNAGDSFLSLAEVQVYATAVTANTWANAAGGSWTTAGNWQGSVIANGSGVTANFATLNLTADATVTLDGTRTIGGLSFADTTPSHNWTLNTGTGGPLTLAVSSGMPATAVANQTTTINTVLAGTQGLLKSGAGTLTLGGANTYTGGTVLSQGTMVHANGQATGSTTTGAITMGDANTGASNLDLRFTTGVQNSNNTTTYKPVTVASNGSGTATLTYNQGSQFANVSLNLGKAVTIRTTASGSQYGMMGAITGNGAGAGNESVVFSAPAGATLYYTAGKSATGVIPNSFLGNVRLTGGGTVALQNLSYLNSAYINGAVPDTASVTVDAGTTWIQNWGSETIDGLNGGGTLSLMNGATTVTVGASGGSGTFTGVLGGSAGFVKLGAGTQTLGGANTYTGATTVSAGTLRVTGSLGASATTVQSGATLAGTGSIGGALAVQSGGTLAPGAAGIGTLTVNNTASLAGTTTMEISKSGATLTTDRLSGVSTLTHGGTLAVTNAGPDSLAAGNSFTLFSATSRAGTFGSVSLPSLASGLVWDQSQLTSNGTITVLASDADADGDGFTNALEVALGTSPSNSGSQPAAIYAGLRGWWKLDETSGTVADDTTGRPQDGTLANSPAWTTGINGGGLSLNGTNQSVSIPNLNQNTNTVTISAWVKRNGSQVNWAGIVFDRGTAVNGMNVSTSNKLGYHWNDSASTYNFDSGLTLPDATWTFCAVVVEATKATIYMQPASGTMQSAVNTLNHPAVAFGSNLHLGQDPAGGRFFKGSLDHVLIHNRALSAAEIGQLYTAGNPPAPGLGSPYDTWASSRGVTATTGDPDGDGITNLLEFFLDGDPLVTEVSILPAVALDEDYLTLSFKRRDDAENLPGGASIGWGSDLDGWTEVPLGIASTGANADGVSVHVDEQGGEPDTITVTIPRALATNGNLFARLKVSE